MKTVILKFIACIRGFSVAEQPKYLDKLPPGIEEAKTIWEQIGFRCDARIIDLVKPYISCIFASENLGNRQISFLLDDFGELEADLVEIVDVDFSDRPLPLVTMKCFFSLCVLDNCADEVRSNIEGNSMELCSCIIPRWDFEDLCKLRDLDLSLGEHSGIDISLLKNLGEEKVYGKAKSGT